MERTKKALEGAFQQFVETRIVEGENLKKDLIAKLDDMLILVDKVERTFSTNHCGVQRKIGNKSKRVIS